MDKISIATRSRNMSAIKSKNTKPEITLRKLLFSLGKRYRIHFKLPGKPDIVFTKTKVAIFVNGCFWHGHGCKVDHLPKSNHEFWSSKILKNKMRDKKVITQLKTSGWIPRVIWECEVRNEPEKALKKILESLGQQPS